ncbi:Uncharacterised protein [Streptococcus pneumoniae]|nr:Uncharacterised protein [Streptococcus pneumoniae]
MSKRAVTDESTPPLIPTTTRVLELSLMVSLPSIRLFTIEGRVCFTIEGRLSSIHYNTLG